MMGPLPKGAKPRLLYAAAEVLALQYLTDSDAITTLLRDCCPPGKEPKVRVMFIRP